MQIQDDRFLHTLARRFLGRSHQLDGGAIQIVDYGSDIAGLEVRISNGLYDVVAITWVNDCAHVLPTALLTADDLAGLEDALDLFIRRFLRKHGVIDARGHSTRKRLA